MNPSKRTSAPPPECIRADLSYDPSSGLFTWTNLKGKRRARAGCIEGKGYVRIGYHGRQFLGHALAWWFVHGALPDEEIDHKNLDRADNRMENLRLATSSQNMANRRGLGRSLKGTFRRRTGRWLAQISSHGRTKYLGSFETEEAASAAYAAAAVSLHGEFARTA